MDGQVVRMTCTHDCPDACAMLVTVRDGRAIDVAPNLAHPVTGRHLCVKVDRYLERVYSPDRILHPLGRVGPKGAPLRLRPGTNGALALGMLHAILADRLEDRDYLERHATGPTFCDALGEVAPAA